MNTNLATIEHQLTAIAPNLQNVLAESGLPVERIIRTVMVSLEINSYLRNAYRNTILQAAMSAAVLGLEVDGVTGQGYLVPFAGKAQFLAGYKGYVSIASRSRRTLEGFVLREGLHQGQAADPQVGKGRGRPLYHRDCGLRDADAG